MRGLRGGPLGAHGEGQRERGKRGAVECPSTRVAGIRHDCLLVGRPLAGRAKKDGRLGARRVGLHFPAPRRAPLPHPQKLVWSPTPTCVMSSPTLMSCWELVLNIADLSFLILLIIAKKNVLRDR